MNNSKSGKNIHKKRNTPWYNDGLRFECQRCGNCCRGEPGTVWINKGEIKGASALLGISPNQFAERGLRIIKGRISLQERGMETASCMTIDAGFMKPGRFNVKPSRSGNPILETRLSGKSRGRLARALVMGNYIQWRR